MRKRNRNKTQKMRIGATIVGAFFSCISISNADSSSGLVSDTFNGPLSSAWTFHDPVGDGVLSTTGTQASILVPAGANHDLWKNSLFAPRIRQAANNTDFEIEAKFDSALSEQYQLQGFTVEQDNTNLIRFDFYTDGSSVKVASASFVNGQPSIKIHSVVTNGSAPQYLRVTRTGNQWIMAYSYNGSDWTTAGSYAHTINVTSVGIFGGNARQDSPEHTAIIDYFMVNGDVPDPTAEGGGTTPDNMPPEITNIQHSVTATTATITWKTDEATDSVVDNGLNSSYSSPAVSNSSLDTDHSILLTNLLPNTTYHYQVGSTDSGDNVTHSLDQVFTTMESTQGIPLVNWLHWSSDTGEFPVPTDSEGETGLKLVDFNKDGRMDYMVSFWQSANSSAPTLVWYQQQANGSFVEHVIDNQIKNLSHTEKFKDIDGDGDLDIAIGEASSGTTISWWENPFPNYNPNTPWVRRTIHNGTKFYHDAIWGDFDGDGKDEYMSWNQRSLQLLMFEIPANPKTDQPWAHSAVFTWTGGGGDHRYRGSDVADINLDGKTDFVGGCGWFEHTGGTNFIQHKIDDSFGYSQVKAGQLVSGGRPEVVCLKESAGSLNMYEWTGSAWQKKILVPSVSASHTLQIGDVNSDGNLDIVYAEMGHFSASSTVDNPNAGIYALYGDGHGSFTRQVIFEGQGHHDGQLKDVNADGKLDIVTKPFKHNMRSIEAWVNQGNQ